MNSLQIFIALMVGFALAFFTQDMLGTTTIANSYIIYMSIIGLIFLSFQVWLYYRDKTPKLVCHNFHTTTDGKHIPAGNFALFSMGDVKSSPLYFKGKDGTVIVPAQAVNKLGEQVACPVDLRPKRFNELDLAVQHKIRQYSSFLRPPYLEGRLSEKQKLTSPDAARLEEEVANQNTLVTMLSEIIKGKFETVGDVLEFLNQAKAGTDKGFVSKLVSAFKRRKQDDELNEI